jgi:hypothetical protein
LRRPANTFNGSLPRRADWRNDPVTYRVTVADHAAARLGPPQVDAAVPFACGLFAEAAFLKEVEGGRPKARSLSWLSR